MPLTTAERVQAFRQRQAALIVGLRAELAGVRRGLAVAETERDTAAAEAERLEAELASGPVARCSRCHGELACPACYRSGGDFAA